MITNDVTERADIDDIVTRFYQMLLDDPIIGYIFTDVVKINLESHLPIIVDFWQDSLFANTLATRRYTGNTLQKHLAIHAQIPLRAGHFTRWLYLFEKAVSAKHAGQNTDKMRHKAQIVAQSIAAAISQQKRNQQQLVLESGDNAKQS